MNEEDFKNEENLEVNDDVSFEPEDGEGNNETLTEKNKKIREDLKVCLAEKNEYLTGWQRAKADYINLKKESEEKFTQGILFGKLGVIDSILPALDSFDMAMGNTDVWESIDPKWRTGVEYIKTQLLTGLADSGVEAFGNTGDVFDPNIHESVETVTGDGAENTIHSVIQKGYKIKERIIRPARVKVWGNK